MTTHCHTRCDVCGELIEPSHSSTRVTISPPDRYQAFNERFLDFCEGCVSKLDALTRSTAKRVDL